MKVTAILYTLVAAAATVSATAIPASNLEVRDTCGDGYGSDQRRTNSPCEPSNGDRHFCGCDRTDVVQCIAGAWYEVQDCGSASCSGGSQGGATC